MHAIKKRPVVVDDQIVIRPMMYLALSYDHRIIDGREAVSFLVRIKECIEDPERMMLAVRGVMVTNGERQVCSNGAQGCARTCHPHTYSRPIRTNSGTAV